MPLDSHAIVLASVPTPQIIAIVGLILVSSFFSMSETVFSSLNPIRIKNYIEADKKGAKQALWIHERFDRALTTILVGNNLANVALATISASVFTQVFRENELFVTVFNTVVMTTILLIFGEIIPKSFAKMHSDKIAVKISRTLLVIMKVLKPVVFVFIKIKSIFLKADERVTISVSEDELETIIDTMEEEGSIDEEEAEMLQSVLDLGEKQVYEIMTPRVDMVAVDVGEDKESILKKFFDNQFSRLPVYEESRDKIVGILYERDFFTMIIKEEPIDVRQLMNPPIFVSKSMRADTLIETLQRENTHLAIVSDEFGGTSGIVTMEDALEELVGEIYDEHDDIDDEYLKQLGSHEYGVNADIELGDLFNELKLGEPPEKEEKTLGSFLFDRFESVPEVDMTYSMIQKMVSYHHEETTQFFKLTFVIKEIKERRIKYVHLDVEPATSDETI